MEYNTHTRDRVTLGYRSAEVVCQTPGSERTLHIVLEVSAWSIGDPERERFQVVAHGPFRSTLAAQQACLGLRDYAPTPLVYPIVVEMVQL
jgi:hypothetical protein